MIAIIANEVVQLGVCQYPDLELKKIPLNIVVTNLDNWIKNLEDENGDLAEASFAADCVHQDVSCSFFSLRQIPPANGI
jgi:hypothetical protein